MLLVKVSTAQGSLGKNEGCEKAPDAIFENLNKNKVKFKSAEVKIAESNLEMTNNFIYHRALNLIDKKSRPVFLGGDHSITFPLYKAFRQFWGKKAGLIVFDAHPDCVQNFKPPSHEDWLRVLIEDKFLKPEQVLLVGAQDYFKTESQFLKEKKIKNWDLEKLRDNFTLAKQDIIKFLKKLESVYLSLDIDVLEPKLAPGTGYRLKDGLKEQEFFELLKLILKTGKVKAVDLVEVNPEKDLKEKTVNTASKIVRELKL
jgi:arginase family enzyme